MKERGSKEREIEKSIIYIYIYEAVKESGNRERKKKKKKIIIRTTSLVLKP